MSRLCTVCQSTKLLAIDRALLRGEMLKTVGARYHLSADAVGRHRKHMRLAMTKATLAIEKQEHEIAYGQSLLGELESIAKDVERLQLELEAGQDRKGALKAIHERLCTLELRAKITGQLETSAKSVTVINQGMSFEDAVKLAREICEVAGFQIMEPSTCDGQISEHKQLPERAQ